MAFSRLNRPGVYWLRNERQLCVQAAMVSEHRNSRVNISPQSSPKKALASRSNSPQKSLSPARPVITPIQKFLNHTATEAQLKMPEILEQPNVDD